VKEIAHGIYSIDGLKMGRSYLVESDDGLALIDTSSKSASEGILAAIAAIGRQPDDLQAIVATHYHFDHTGNAAALVERSGAELCVHEDDVPYVEGRIPWLPSRGPIGPMLDKFAPAHFTLKVGRVLHEGDQLPFAGGLDIIHAPGHTPGHIALYAREHRTLFAGDALMNVGGLHLPMSTSSHDMEQARQSVRRLLEFDFDIALPGHGAPILGRANEKIAEWSHRWL
jgi:glyoxylase-like metal-dependent hydrolase (beta-lactamase superfamily II)